MVDRMRKRLTDLGEVVAFGLFGAAGWPVHTSLGLVTSAVALMAFCWVVAG